MAGYRIERLEEDLKRELSAIIPELKDPGITSLISVLRVVLAGDLSVADIRITSLEGLDAAKNAVAALKRAEGYIKRTLSARLKMRKMPALRFLADDSIAYGAEISTLLKTLLPETDQKEDATHDTVGG